MASMNKKLLILLTMLSNAGFCASYDTLPKGVNTIVFKQATTTNIESKYDANKSSEQLMLSETFSTNNLSEISEVIQSYFNELKKLSPDAYNAFSLGEFEGKAEASANAQGVGIGYGITDRFTIYGSIPFYHIKTNVNFYQKTPSNLNAIKNTVNNSNPTDAIGTFVKQLTLQLPDTNEELLQSVLVNYYHYKPLGTWEKDAIGDAEIGAIYRLTNFSDKGSALSFGAVLPTGSIDDPDSLQDVSTGDGQTDFFIESMNGIGFFDNQLQFDLRAKYTYQFAHDRKMRLYNDPNVPLGTDSAILREKLGDKIDTATSITLNANNWFSISAAYLYNKTFKANYNISDAAIKNALEHGTDTVSEWAKLSLGFSTVELYKKKQFEVPFEISLSGQKLINAQNAADYSRIDIDLKLYY
jgi:hypothetical protein